MMAEATETEMKLAKAYDDLAKAKSVKRRRDLNKYIKRLKAEQIRRRQA